MRDLDILDCISRYKCLGNNLENAIPRYPLKAYEFTSEAGDQIIAFTRSLRNIASLDHFASGVDRLSEFYIAVEYFQGSVQLTRDVKDFSDADREKFFVTLAADSIRSALDMFSNSISSFFDLEKSEKRDGFRFKPFLTELKEKSEILFIIGNDLYQSESYKAVKDFRDSHKHKGLNKREISIASNPNSFKASISNPLPISMNEVKKALMTLFEQVEDFITRFVQIARDTEKGFISPRDRYYLVNGDELSSKLIEREVGGV